MRIIVGLGNPGAEFENTRHNLGFYIVDRFWRERGCSPFSLFLGSQISLDNYLGSSKFILCKPFEFMNSSGKTLWKIFRELKIPIDNMLLIYDELDLPLGKLKVTKKKDRHISHKGVKDIDDNFSGEKILKIKVGIGPISRKNLIIKDYVMEKFSEEELFSILQLEGTIFQIIERFIQLPENYLPAPLNYLSRK